MASKQLEKIFFSLLQLGQVCVACTERCVCVCIHCAYTEIPHNVQGAIKVVCHMSYSMPAKKCILLRQLQEWLRARAGWRGEEHTSWFQWEDALLHAYQPTWSTDFAALGVMITACCPQAGCVRAIQ